MYHRFDAIVVGAGGAGLMAALQLAQTPGISTAVISKLYPSRSHTGAAQGGIGAALGNLEEDHPEWHTFDTVKGGDYLVDQTAADVMCHEAVESVYELEHYGLPFSRTPDGKIAQRRFGGHTRNFGEAPVRRSCFAADRTGHMILQTLYQQCIKHEVNFYSEFQLLDLVFNDGVCCGIVALNIKDGEIHTFHAKAVLFATGGFGRAWKITSNALSNTGDGVAIAYRHGIPLEDMELYQFHPTGVYKLGILLTEGARGEGGILRNSEGERFTERYAPTLLDLAPRDMVSRFIYQEVREGRGINGGDFVHLDLTHLGAEVVEKKLPDLADFVRTYLGLDPVRELIPIQPTAHYAMGGIPTDIDGRVITGEHNTPLPGFYAAGECACVSVHGANRLGTNSLVDIVVFGRRAGRHMARYVQETGFTQLPQKPDLYAREQVGQLLARETGESAARIRSALQEEMMDKVSVVRSEEKLRAAQRTVRQLKEQYRHVAMQDRQTWYNSELHETMEVGYLLDLSESIIAGALAREESRGGHYREDYPTRDDVNFLRHTLVYDTPDGLQIRYKPVDLSKFEPKERKY
ncbi:MAG: succinate dehydrogenase flavoprotein subunit [Chloroflexota bacterium]|nr:succinate dehydrogenase flavoprotein subunit [Chloroflexota bacterium]